MRDRECFRQEATATLRSFFAHSAFEIVARSVLADRSRPAAMSAPLFSIKRMVHASRSASFNFASAKTHAQYSRRKRHGVQQALPSAANALVLRRRSHWRCRCNPIDISRDKYPFLTHQDKWRVSTPVRHSRGSLNPNRILSRNYVTRRCHRAPGPGC